MTHTIERRAGAAWQVCRRGFLSGVLAIAALAAASGADASTYRWQADVSGDWNVPGNWEVVEGPAGAGYPNLAGDVAVFDEPLTAARTVTIPDAVTITIGRLTVAHANAAGQVTIARAGTGLLVFDNAGDDAVIETSGAGEPTIFSTPIQLATHLTASGKIELSSIGEAVAGRNVTATGGDVRLTRTNTYTGTTTVTDGQLLVAPTGGVGSAVLGTLVVGDGTGAAGSAICLVAGDAISHSADVLVNVDGRATFSPTFGGGTADHVIDGLTIDGGAVVIFEIGSSLTVQDLTMTGGVVVASSPGTALRLAGSLTATSTAAGPAAIRSGGTSLPRAFTLLPGNHDFNVADGPAAVDFSIETFFFGGTDETSAFTKNGPGVMRIDSSSAPETRVLDGTLLIGGSGILQTRSLTLAAGSRLPIDITTGAPGSGYDQLKVTGAVTLTSGSLDVTSPFLLPPDAAFVIIDNDGVDPVNGTFAGLAEGASFVTPGGATLHISYAGGDGNDVVLANVTPVTYFLSEGATGTFFDEDVLIANPNTMPAPVTMTFFLPGGGTIDHEAIVPAQSRLTVKVDEIDGLENMTASVDVRSDNRLTLAVERTMFWDSTHYGGHTANAVSRAEPQWLFAEGVQNGFFDTFLLLANPNGAMNATVTFLRESEPPFVLDVPLAEQSRTTVNASDHAELVGRSFGIVVDAPAPITAERATYFATTPQRIWSGGHDNAGSPAAATSWFHPEGASGTFFSTFILMSNPHTSPANVTMRFLLPGGVDPIEISKTIGAQQRLTINPATEGIAALQNAAFSTVVTSDVPIVSERAMYWNTDDTVFGEGHASSGLTAPANAWVLAEGRVGGPNAYTTYILLANPGSAASSVTVTFLRESGTPVVKNYEVPANSRFNIDVGSMVPELQNESFGTLIQVMAGEAIAVERSMYWNVNGRFWSGGTNAVGSVLPQ